MVFGKLWNGGVIDETATVTGIQRALRMSQEDLDCAPLIVGDMATAVFRHNDAMCEPATHCKWAKHIFERAKWHGVKAAEHADANHAFQPAGTEQ